MPLFFCHCSGCSILFRKTIVSMLNNTVCFLGVLMQLKSRCRSSKIACGPWSENLFELYFFSTITAVYIALSYKQSKTSIKYSIAKSRSRSGFCHFRVGHNVGDCLMPRRRKEPLSGAGCILASFARHVYNPVKKNFEAAPFRSLLLYFRLDSMCAKIAFRYLLCKHRPFSVQLTGNIRMLHPGR